MIDTDVGHINFTRGWKLNMNKFDFSFQDIVENAKDIVIVTKAFPIEAPGPEIVYVNKAFTELTGYTYEEAIGRNPRILQSVKTDPAIKQQIREALENVQPVRATIQNFSKSGRAYWLDLSILPLQNTAGSVTHFAAIERDITAQKEYELKLDELSRTDPLTGLLNRRAFYHAMDNELARFQRTESKYSLLMTDIDHFKHINDKYGHPLGDRVIKEVGGLCKSLFRMQDSAARLGGEEFGILLADTNIDTALVIAERLRKTIDETIMAKANVEDQVADSPSNVTVSIGVAEVSTADADSVDVVWRADKALYTAKQAGRNCVCKQDA